MVVEEREERRLEEREERERKQVTTTNQRERDCVHNKQREIAPPLPHLVSLSHKLEQI